MLALAAALAAASGGIRWVPVPRASARRSLLVASVIGLACGHAISDLGMFLAPPTLPRTKLVFLGWSAAGLAQFVPLYVRNPVAGKGPADPSA